MPGTYYTIPRGSKHPNSRVLGPKAHTLNGSWTLKPYYLGTWTLRDTPLGRPQLAGFAVLPSIWLAKVRSNECGGMWKFLRA